MAAMRGQVLLVEDDLGIRDILKLSLEYDGYTVRSVANGREALDAVKSFSPDVVVLYLHMPFMDGNAFLDQRVSHAILSKVPVVVISALPPGHPLAAGLIRFPDVKFLPKPIEFQTLTSAIERLIQEASPT